jgi:uncharacterized protein
MTLLEALRQMNADIASEPAVLSLLRQLNPWWSGRPFPQVPKVRRDAVTQVGTALSGTTGPVRLLLSGPRRAGKSTVLLQVVQELIDGGFPPGKVMYATFDHPLLRLAGLRSVVDAWRHSTPRASGQSYLLIDEIQYAPDWQDWLKAAAAAHDPSHIIASASALPKDAVELEVAEWRVVHVSTFSFGEFLRLAYQAPPVLPEVGDLKDLLSWEPDQFEAAGARAEGSVAHFSDFLLRGGFPETVAAGGLEAAHASLRENVLDRLMRCDLSALYGLRRIAELERLFLHLCTSGSGLVQLQKLSEALDVSKNTVRSHLDLLEAVHLIYKLPPFGYGSEVQRGRIKVHPADPSLGIAMMMRGPEVLEDARSVAAVVEGCAFKHLFHRYLGGGPSFSYWRGKEGEEISMIATGSSQSRPFAVHYSDSPADQQALKGLRRFCADRDVKLAYVITKRLDDFGRMTLSHPDRGNDGDLPTICMRVPALLFCYWMSRPPAPETAKQGQGWFAGVR